MQILFFDTLDSTNNYCKLLDPSKVGEFTVIWAGNQTAGIGQQGNVWVSEPYKNLTLSLILKPTFLALTDQWLLSMTLALAVTDTIENILSKSKIQNPFFIKWPNDIYIDDNKVCGILITNRVSNNHISQSICGIGLNVNQTIFPDWVPNPTSLSLETGKNHELKPLLELLLYNLESRYLQLKKNPDSIKPDYMSRLYRLGKPSPYIYNGNQITAIISDVDRLGHLHLLTDNHEEITCDLKEIKFVI